MKEIVTAFGYPFFVRSAIPGLVLLLVLWPLVGGTFQASLTVAGASPFELSVAFFLVAILLGWLVSLLDYPIYVFFEGRRGWPIRLRTMLENRLKRRVRKLLSESKLDRKVHEREVREAFFQLRMFYLAAPGKFEVQAPTRLGNVIRAYEGYSLTRYGMDPVFYWYRLRYVLSKDVREDLDTSAAEAAAMVYLCTVLGVSAMAYISIALASAECRPLVAFTTEVLRAVLHLPDFSQAFASALAPILVPLPPALTSLLYGLFGTLLMLLAYGAYRAAIPLHRRYGELFKASFDIGRRDLMSKLGLQFGTVNEKEQWDALFKRLQYLSAKRD